ncbi:MAG: hypothetical protein NQ127_01300 [Candidatus Cardinium sp.]|nr:hypothetical protein [Candidatus Cardinium sp.]
MVLTIKFLEKKMRTRNNFKLGIAPLCFLATSLWNCSRSQYAMADKNQNNGQGSSSTSSSNPSISSKKTGITPTLKQKTQCPYCLRMSKNDKFCNFCCFPLKFYELEVGPKEDPEENLEEGKKAYPSTSSKEPGTIPTLKQKTESPHKLEIAYPEKDKKEDKKA